VYLWEELVKQLCRDQPGNTRLSRKRRVLSSSYSSSPPLCVGPYPARSPCVFLLRRTLGRERDRERAPAGRFCWEASQSRVGPGRSQVCPCFNSPHSCRRRERVACSCVYVFRCFCVYFHHSGGRCLYINKDKRTSNTYLFKLPASSLCVCMYVCVYT